jgi:predicted nuclease of predicted toxin-antitoxin system
MGVSGKVVSWLQDQGHDATHLKDEGLQRLPDPEIFEKATVENRVILTFDLDFGEIASLAKGKTSPGVIVFRLRNTRTNHVIDRLKSVLNSSEFELQSGAVIVVEETRHRIRELPIRRT